MESPVADRLDGATGTTIAMPYRAFAANYEDSINSDTPADPKLRPLWTGALRTLAFRMLASDDPAEMLVALDRRIAEGWLADFMASEDRRASGDAHGLLRDLLRVHLLLSGAPGRVEFVHQSFL